MISKFNIAKALIDQAQVVADANTYLLIPRGKQFTPEVNVMHVEEYVLYGDDNSVGLSDNSSDIQFGIYQLSIHTPKTETKWNGLSVVDIFQASFVKGLQLTSGGQMLRIKSSALGPMFQNDTHFIHILSITYSVIG